MDINKLKLTEKRKQICERLDLKDSEDIIHYYHGKPISEYIANDLFHVIMYLDKQYLF